MTLITITETVRHLLTRPLGWLVLLPVFLGVAAALYPWRGTRNIHIRIKPVPPHLRVSRGQVLPFHLPRAS